MLHFTFGTPASFHLTLSEMSTLDAPVYLLVFTRCAVGRTVAVVLSPEASDNRSQEFALDVDTVLADCEPGQYTYHVYEQTDINNTDPAQAVGLLEHGIMHLHPETPFAFTQPATATAYTLPA